MSRTEPYVKVQENVMKAPSIVEADNNADVGVVILSDYGPRLARVTGPSGYVKTFTKDGVVPRDADISFINAYYMSYFSALVVVRSMNTTASKGLLYYTVNAGDDSESISYLTNKEMMFKDDNILDHQLDWKFRLTNDQSGSIAIEVNDTVYYSNITEDDLKSQYSLMNRYNSFIELEKLYFQVPTGYTPEDAIDQYTEFVNDLKLRLGLLEGVFIDEVVGYSDPNYQNPIKLSDFSGGLSSIYFRVIGTYSDDALYFDDYATAEVGTTEYNYCGYCYDSSSILDQEIDLTPSKLPNTASWSGTNLGSHDLSKWLLYLGGEVNSVIYCGYSDNEIATKISEINDAYDTVVSNKFRVSKNNTSQQIINKLGSIGITVTDCKFDFESSQEVWTPGSTNAISLGYNTSNKSFSGTNVDYILPDESTSTLPNIYLDSYGNLNYIESVGTSGTASLDAGWVVGTQSPEFSISKDPFNVSGTDGLNLGIGRIGTYTSDADAEITISNTEFGTDGFGFSLASTSAIYVNGSTNSFCGTEVSGFTIKDENDSVIFSNSDTSAASTSGTYKVEYTNDNSTYLIKSAEVSIDSGTATINSTNGVILNASYDYSKVTDDYYNDVHTLVVDGSDSNEVTLKIYKDASKIKARYSVGFDQESGKLITRVNDVEISGTNGIPAESNYAIKVLDKSGILVNTTKLVDNEVYIKLNASSDFENAPSKIVFGDISSNLEISSLVISSMIRRFSIMADNSGATDYLKIGVSNAIADTFDIDFNDDKYLVSLNKDATDSSDANIYIDYLNTLDLGFKVKVYESMNKDSYSVAEISSDLWPWFGKGSNKEASSSIGYLLDAAELLGDQDKYNLSYLSCVGITRLAFVNRMSLIADNKYLQMPIDIPYDRTNVGTIKKYFNDLNIDNDQCIAVGPFDINQSLTGWKNYIAASSLWFERLMSNRSNGDEFAPIYTENYGVLNYTEPVKLLTEPQRTQLLNAGSPINYAVYDSISDLYSLNNNLTHQHEDNIMSEDHNRRLVNKINRDIKRNMRQFITRQNNTTTRTNVEDMVKYYMNNNIMNQSYPPEKYEVICNKSNNTDEIIAAGKLAVKIRARLYNTIKEIDVLDELYPINVDFEE